MDEYYRQETLDIKSSQTHVVGADTLGRISCKFTEAKTEQLMDEISSVLSVASHASAPGRFCSLAAAASCLVSKDRTSEQALVGAVSTIKSFLVGKCAAAKKG